MKKLAYVLVVFFLVSTIVFPATKAFAKTNANLQIQNKLGTTVTVLLVGSRTYSFSVPAGKSTYQLETGQYKISYSACGGTRTTKLNLKTSGSYLVLAKCPKKSDVSDKKAESCDPSYPTVCIPPRPPDLDCNDIPYRRFRVIGRDPHNFDGDHDGIGCEW